MRSQVIRCVRGTGRFRVARSRLDTFKGPRRALAKGSAEGRRETGFWDPVTYIGIRGCLLIPTACAVQSVALRGHELLARSAAHKHANEDIPHVYTCGPADRPAGGGQRLISVSLALRQAGESWKMIGLYPRPALPRHLVAAARVRQPVRRLLSPCIVRRGRLASLLSAFHHRHVTESR